MVRLFSHRIGTANWFTVEMGCYSGGYSCENSLLFHERGLILGNEDRYAYVTIFAWSWNAFLRTTRVRCDQISRGGRLETFCATDKCCSNGDYRRLVDYTYRILVFDVIIFSDNFIRTSNTNIIYFWGYVICDIAMTNEDLLIQFKKLLYNECIRLYILNLNLFQKLNHYNNIAGRIPLDPLSIYLLISSVSLIWSVA